jgi:hypothetical protein
MGAVTYPNQEVVELINTRFIPLKFESTTDQKKFEAFNVQWTPTIIIYDHNRKEHHRTTGFLSPEDFILEMKMGLARREYDLQHFSEATDAYRQILQAYPKTSAAPEALYFSGVCNYMASHDPSHLKHTSKELQQLYPKSDWTKKAQVWTT